MFVHYNTVDFEILKTNDFLVEAVYSDDQTDYLYTHIRIDVDGILNPETMAYRKIGGVPIPEAGTMPGLTHTAIRHDLMQPRKQLEISDIDGLGNITIVLECPALGYESDVRNGPLPSTCSVRGVIGSRAWLIRWTCDCWIIECPSSDPTLLSNRWSESHLINNYHLTTRTIVGKMVFRRDFLDNANQVAHDFLNSTTAPKTPPGFQRESIDVAAESSGLSLIYRIVEREKMYDKGDTDARGGFAGGGFASGIVRIDGSFGITSMNTPEGPAAGMSMAQFDIRVYGNKYANQWTMIQRCFQIAIYKLQLQRDNAVGYVQNAAIRESLGEDEKWVDVSITYWQPAGPAPRGLPRIDPLRVDVGDLFLPQGGVNPGFPNQGGTRGSAIITAMTEALKDACSLPSEPPIVGTSTREPQPYPSGPPPDIQVYPRNDIPDDYERKYGVDPNLIQDPYTHYRMSLEYNIENSVFQAPTTGPPPGGSFGGGSGGTGSISASGPGSESWSWPSAIFQVASPTGRIRVSFVAERIGIPPNIPTLTPEDDNLVYSRHILKPSSPITWNDGSTPVYNVNGWYEFFLRRVPQLGDSYAMGRLPWTNFAFTEAVLSPSDFVDDMYEYSPLSSGGSGGFGTST